MSEYFVPEYAGRKNKTPEQALSSLMRLCARAEKSSGDAIRLMRGWGLVEKDMREVLGKLVSAGFIDDNRYAETYTREKINLNGWGEYKIGTHLKRKGISDDIIRKALGGIDKNKQKNRLAELLHKKKVKLNIDNSFELKNKLLRYGAGLGYGYEEVMNTVGEIMAEE